MLPHLTGWVAWLVSIGVAITFIVLVCVVAEIVTEVLPRKRSERS